MFECMPPNGRCLRGHARRMMESGLGERWMSAHPFAAGPRLRWQPGRGPPSEPKKPCEDDAEVTSERHRARMAFLKDKLGLMPARSRLVLRLVAGDSVRLSAAALGIGYETARTILKSVFRKTRTCRRCHNATRRRSRDIPSNRGRNPLASKPYALLRVRNLQDKRRTSRQSKSPLEERGPAHAHRPTGVSPCPARVHSIWEPCTIP
jgi:hypothetical protein